MSLTLGCNMKVYLAGPMRGYPKYNFPAFEFAAEKLRKEGYEVFSPAEKGEEKLLEKDPGFSKGSSGFQSGDHTVEGSSLQYQLDFRRKVFLADTAYICQHADAVFLMEGWEKSSGAVAEKALAEAIGLEVRVLEPEYNVRRVHGTTD